SDQYSPEDFLKIVKIVTGEFMNVIWVIGTTDEPSSDFLNELYDLFKWAWTNAPMESIITQASKIRWLVNSMNFNGNYEYTLPFMKIIFDRVLVDEWGYYVHPILRQSKENSPYFDLLSVDWLINERTKPSMEYDF